MNNTLSALKIAFLNYPAIALIFTIPFVTWLLVKYKKINIVRLVWGYVFLLYIVCAYAIIVFPLPTKQLSTYDMQLIPFKFISDIVKEGVLSSSTHGGMAAVVFNKAVIQILLNMLLTVPFGILLKYYFDLSGKEIIMAAFLLSIFFELTQLTGFFFRFSGSYRLFDVDDLMMNTLGGYIGYKLMQLVMKHIPIIQKRSARLLSASGTCLATTEVERRRALARR